MKKRSLFLILVIITTCFTGCNYNFIVPEEIIVPTEPVSYSIQIQPIFTNKCVECHKPGGDSPDLTVGNSYNQIVPSQINVATPVNSRIYSFPAPSTSTHTWKKYSLNEANLVLIWIEEGAKNN